jgi:hypothetical protein
MRTTGARKIVLTAAAMLTLGGSAYGQKSDADGVILIAQKRADQRGVTTDDTPGFPVTISESGSYRLGSNLILPDGDTTGIEIMAATVTVDLNGFSIVGPDIAGNGAGIRSQGVGTAVLNGTVLNVGSVGVDLRQGVPGSPSCRVERVHSLRNWGGGIRTNRGCTIVNNVVSATRSIGISAGGGATVIGNTVRANTGLGMSLAGDAGYAQNVLTENNGGNANVQVSGGIQMGMNICGGTLCPP